jgi:dTDP-4-dehydrorhamnose reductase
VKESNVSWLITRIADVYGVNLAEPTEGSSARHVWERSGGALGLVERLREGSTLPAPADVYRSPTYVWDYAQRVCELVAERRDGVLHTAGPDAMHRREYLRLLARAFGCDPGLVRPGGIGAYLEACGEDQRLPLPPNTALDDERARAALGHPAVDVETGLARMSDQLRRVLERSG